MSGTDFALIGPGRLGLHLASALQASGYRCVAVRSRSSAEGRSKPALEDALWDTWDRQAPWPPFSFAMICVSDSSIPEVARLFAASVPLAGRCVFHTSGFFTAEELRPCTEHGAFTASWHPLQSFPDPSDGSTTAGFRGVWCAIEGAGPAVARGEEIAKALGMFPWRIAPTCKQQYHAAAAVAANLTHVLVAEAYSLLVACGLSPSASRRALMALATTSLGEALRGEGLDRLTGPMARGDDAIVNGHLALLPEALADVYRTLWELVKERGTSIDPR